MLSIDISIECCPLAIDEERPRRAAQAILRDAQIDERSLSIAVVDDATMHGLNRQYLEHDYPTDVLSFTLERSPGKIEGEVIVNFDMAAGRAGEFGWSAEDELLLYVIHGTLHLVGYDDGSDEARAEMRAAERRYLALFRLQPRQQPASDGARGP